MENKTKRKNNEKSIIYILIFVFILTEIIDFLLDHLLGNSILHSTLQLILFVFLFLTIYQLFIKYTSKKIKKLVPENLMKILQIIKNEKSKNVLINQRKMRKLLNITKPTLKKRVDSLLELKYISFEKTGNNVYFILTPLGESIVG